MRDSPYCHFSLKKGKKIKIKSHLGKTRKYCRTSNDRVHKHIGWNLATHPINVVAKYSELFYSVWVMPMMPMSLNIATNLEGMCLRSVMLLFYVLGVKIKPYSFKHPCVHLLFWLVFNSPKLGVEWHLYVDVNMLQCLIFSCVTEKMLV